MMTKLRPAYVYLAVGVALIMGWFYWYEYRPEQIRQECAASLIESAASQGRYEGIRTVQNMCEDAGGVSNYWDAVAKGMAQNRSIEEATPVEEWECAVNEETGEC